MKGLKRIIGIICLVMFTGLFAYIGINANSVNAATSYTYTYDGSSWSPSPQSSYNVGDTIKIANSTNAINAYITINDDNQIPAITKNTPYTYTVENDGATLTFSGSVATILDASGYSVTFDANGGTGTVPTTDTKYKAGDSITLSDGTELTNEGYTFVGWNTDSSATTGNTGSYAIQESDIISGSIKFYAIWKDSRVNVTFNTNGGDGTAPSTDDKYKAGDSITLSDGTGLTRNGYTFVGWSINALATTGYTGSYTIQEFDIIDESITFYAIWEIVPHTCNSIVFDKELPSGEALASGNYFLIDNVKASSSYKIAIGSEVNICLNGKIWNLNENKISIDGGGTLNIYDCGTGNHYFTVDADEWTLADSTTDYYVTGGVIYNGCGETGAIDNDGTLNTYEVNFVGNKANSSAAIRNGFTLNIYGGEFKGNQGSEGGAINCCVSGVIEYALFAYNSGNCGGAIHANGNITISNCEFLNNKVNDSENDANGGAIINFGTLNIYDSTFKFNTASDNGGAIHNASGSHALVERCTIQNNSAPNGGGISNSSCLTLINTSITANTSTENGAGVYLFEDDNCLPEGTLITMADGSTKKIEKINEGDWVRTFDHETGTLSSEEVFLVYKGSEKAKAFTLHFTNDIELSIVGKHDLFEKSSLKYVTINEDNASSYIGKYFYNANNNRYEKLLSVTKDTNYYDFYSIYSAHHLNCVANNMLTVADDVDYFLNIFDFDSSLKINQAQKLADINQYGLYDYEKVKDYISEEDFDNLNCKYANIVSGKGYMTYDEMLGLRIQTNEYIDNRKNSRRFNGLLGGTLNTTNTATTYIKGISGLALILGSDVTITGNTVNSKASNLYITSDALDRVYIIKNATNINAGLSFEEAGTIVSTYAIAIEPGTETITSSSEATAIKAYFTSDSSDYCIKTKENAGTPKTYSVNAYKYYPVEYDKNGGSGTLSPTETETYAIGDEIAFADGSALTKTGYKFLGWNTSSTATTALTLTNGKYVIVESDVVEEKITFYAVWEEKTTISIDTDTQRFVYDSTSITPVLKDTDGEAITLSGFSYTYEMYYYSDFGACSDTVEPGLYKVHITRAEDETYKAVDTYIEYVVTYSLTYKANTGVGDDVIDISDNDTIHKDYFGPYCESDFLGYYFDAQANIKTNTFTKENYTFAFWNTKQDGTGKSYNPGELVTLLDNTILYACYSANISAQPTKDNNYSVSVATTDSVTYTWEKESVILTPVDLTKDITGTVNVSAGTITAVLQGSKYTIVVPGSMTKQLMFYTEDTLEDGVIGVDNTYLYSAQGFKAKIYIITSSTEFTISNISYRSTEYTTISGETTNSITNANENTNYRCVVKSMFNAVSYSDVLTPKAVSFNGGENATGTAPATLYQLEGRTVNIPANTFTKDGYKYLGWNSDSNATTAQTFNDGKYTIGSSDTTFYAIWEDLAYAEDITFTITTLEYGVKASDITVTVSDNKLKVTAFKLWYFDEATTTTVEVDTVTKPGLYSMYVIVEGKDDAYYFVNEVSAFMNYYSGTVSVNGNTIYFNPGTMTYPHSCGVTTCDISETTDFLGTESSKASENVVLGNRLYFNLTGNSVIYDDNVEDDSVSDMPEDENTYLENSSVTISTTVPTRGGYAFEGWSLTENGSVITTSTITMGSSDITLYAQWTSLAYNEDISISITPLTYGIKASDVVATITNAAKDDVEVVALKLRKLVIDTTYDVTTVTNCGTYCFDFVLKCKDSNYYFENIVSGLDTIYTGEVSFGTGYYSPIIKAVKSYDIESTHCVVDIENTYNNKYLYINIMCNYPGDSVTYYDNLEDEVVSVPTDNAKYLVDAPVTLLTEVGSRKGYTFKGWSLTTNGDVITTSTVKMVSGGLKFYAIWEVVTHTCDDITYNIPFTTETSHTLVSGNYYLYEDITINNAYRIERGNNINLCLNGHKIIFVNNNEPGFILYEASLMITDCEYGKDGATGGIYTTSYYNGNYDRSVVKVNSNEDELAKLTLKNLNIELEGRISVVCVSNPVDYDIEIDNCSIIVDYSVLQNKSNTNTNTVFTLKNSSVKRDLETSDFYTELFGVIGNDRKNNKINLINSKIENNYNATFDLVKVTLDIDSKSIITSNFYYNVMRLENSELNLKGEVKNIYQVKETDSDKSVQNTSVILARGNANINLYGTAAITPIEGKASIYIHTLEDENSYIYVKEELKQTEPFGIYVGGYDSYDDLRLIARDAIYDFKATNPNKDLASYFEVVYSDIDVKTPYFFEQDKENDIIRLVEVEFTTEPTVETKKAVANNDNVTYQWYKLTDAKDNKLTADDVSKMKNVSVNDKGNFVLAGSYMTINYKTALMNLSSFNVNFLKGQTFTATYDYFSEPFSIYSYSEKVNQFKVYYKSGDAWEVVDDTDLITSDCLGTYEDGIWSSYSFEEDGVPFSNLILTFDNSTGSKYEGMTELEVKLELVTDLSLISISSDMVSYFSNAIDIDADSILMGGEFVITYDSTIFTAVDGETSTTFTSSKAGTYACGATLDNRTIYSDSFTIDYLDVEISDEATEVTYNGQAQAYEIKGTNKDLDSFKVEYLVGDDWTENAPVNAGSYDVKISRAQDDYYDAFEKTITKGLVINKYEVTVTTNYDDTFTYNGKDQSSSVTATYKNVLGNDVSLVMYSCLPGNVNKMDSVPFTDAGCYIMLFKFASDEEKNNYCIPDTTTYYEDYYTMLEKEIVIDWEVKTYTYNGNVLTIPTASYKDVNNQVISLTVAMDKELKNAGSYVATVTFANKEANYSLPTTTTKEYTVNKMKVNEPSISGTYTYNGTKQTVTLTGVESYMETASALIKTDAGSYDIVFTLDNNHEWANDGDGVITWVIEKAINTITVDTSDIVKTYGEEVVLPSATSLFGDVLVSKQASDLANAGSYEVVYSVDGTSNYDTVTVSVNVVINKLQVSEPSVIGNYVCNEKNQTVNLTGVESYMTTSDSLSQTNAGVYTINYTLDNNHEWADGSDGKITWEIKAPAISHNDEEEKTDVVVETEEGFSSDITVTVEVTVEEAIVEKIENSDLLVDYYNIDDANVKLDKHEKVGVIYDVKLIRTINGVSEVIQPEDIKPGTKIKVRMLIPEDVDLSKLTKILHVHANNDIEVFQFDESKLDSEGYYEIEIDRLSEFAFVYYESCYTHYVLIALFILFLTVVFLMWSIFYIRSLRNAYNKINVLPLVVFGTHLVLTSVTALFAGCGTCIVFIILNFVALVLAILLYAIFSEKLDAKLDEEDLEDDEEEEDDNESNDNESSDSSEESSESNETNEETSSESKDKEPKESSEDNESNDSSESGDSEEDEYRREEVVIDGVEMILMYVKSLQASIQLGSDELKQRYVDLMNYLQGYTDIHSRKSYKGISFSKARTMLFQIEVKGKTLYLHLNLDKEEYKDSKYNLKETTTKKFEDVPMLLKIKSDRAFGYAKELIEILAQKNECNYDETKVGTDSIENYPYEPKDTLIEKGLVKKTYFKKKVSTVEIVETKVEK